MITPAELLAALDLTGATCEELIAMPGEGSIYAVEMSATDSLERWSTARTRGARIGWTPIAVGSHEELEFLREAIGDTQDDDDRDVAGWREQAITLDVAAWLEQRRAEHELVVPHAAWPMDAEPASGFYFPFDEQGVHLERWWMLLVPTEYDWEVPLLLGFGGWSSSPGPEVHAAFLRHWSHRYEAELIAVNSDSMELLISRPPTSPEDALALAEAQFYYCPDIVEQGYGSVEALAAALIGGTTWFLWWD